LHPTQVSTWKKQAVEGLSGVFSEGGKPHTALDKRTPDEAYFVSKELKKAA